MSGDRGFLSRHIKDRRFRRSENLILDVFMREYENGITVKKIARKAGLARSTIYIHHRAVKDIIPDYEEYILVEFSHAIKNKLKKYDIELNSLYFEMLIFIIKNKRVFAMFLKFDDRKAFEKMIKKMEKEIVKYARLPKNFDKIMRIYSSEVIEMIFEWGKRGFPEKELPRVLADIMYLTGTCRERLMPINHA